MWLISFFEFTPLYGRNLNEAPHGFVSPREICRLPPKVAKLLNLAVNLEKIVVSGTGVNLKLPPKVTKHSNLAVNTYETAQTQSFRMY